MLTTANQQAQSTTSAGRIGSSLLLIGGLTALMVTAAAVIDPDIAQAGKGAYLASGVVMSLVDLAVAVGLAFVATSIPLALGRLRTPVIVLTVGASAGMVFAEGALRASFATGNALFGVFGPLQALGLIALGIGIVRARAWTSWRRFALLGWGLYVPILMLPLLISSGGTSLVALAGYHLGVVAAAVATRIELGRAG